MEYTSEKAVGNQASKPSVASQIYGAVWKEFSVGVKTGNFRQLNEVRETKLWHRVYDMK